MIKETMWLSGTGDFTSSVKDAWNWFTEDRSATRYQAAVRVNTFDQVEGLLSKYIADPTVRQWAALQVMLETNGLLSRVSLDDNNLSGITFINKPTIQKNATIGRKKPEGGNYAHFATQSDWAKDFVRILSFGSKPPIKATTLRDYVNRLHDNGYFKSSPDLYYQALNNMQLSLPAAKQKQVENKALNPGQQDPTGGTFDKVEKWIKDNPLLAALAGLGTILVVKKIMD